MFHQQQQLAYCKLLLLALGNCAMYLINLIFIRRICHANLDLAIWLDPSQFMFLTFKLKIHFIKVHFLVFYFELLALFYSIFACIRRLNLFCTSLNFHAIYLSILLSLVSRSACLSIAFSSLAPSHCLRVTSLFVSLFDGKTFPFICISLIKIALFCSAHS